MRSLFAARPQRRVFSLTFLRPTLADLLPLLFVRRKNLFDELGDQSSGLLTGILGNVPGTMDQPHYGLRVWELILNGVGVTYESRRKFRQSASSSPTVENASSTRVKPVGWG